MRCSEDPASRRATSVRSTGRPLAGALLSLVLVGSAIAAVPGEFAAVLDRLPAAARDALQRQSAQWASWSPTQRAAFTRRAAAWDRLPAIERGRQRERYLAWQALPNAEREQVAAAAATYRTLPDDARKALRAQFDALDRRLQRGWLLGPVLGPDYARLQPLLAQLPEAEHAPMLHCLRDMTPAQRADLAVLVQRTAPQDRPALRKELLATSSGNRAAWLWRRLDQ
ncbi:DUF3106 domain-containing protein [Lysobacter psychrotolerans]|uniref:DUF3106 domain-containing protein n=1 Tax=Montanilutibacter psychrotolerans TaxID=1327343 RepID=A0A3M8T1D6_9GAMM|nr:DUF3106 domain-containing protein [Lysobacter psychrotolerans]